MIYINLLEGAHIVQVRSRNHHIPPYFSLHNYITHDNTMQDKLLHFSFVKREYLLKSDLGATLESKELLSNSFVVVL